MRYEACHEVCWHHKVCWREAWGLPCGSLTLCGVRPATRSADIMRSTDIMRSEVCWHEAWGLSWGSLTLWGVRPAMKSVDIMSEVCWHEAWGLPSSYWPYEVWDLPRGLLLTAISKQVRERTAKSAAMGRTSFSSGTPDSTDGGSAAFRLHSSGRKASAPVPVRGSFSGGGK